MHDLGCPDHGTLDIDINCGLCDGRQAAGEAIYVSIESTTSMDDPWGGVPWIWGTPIGDPSINYR